MRSVSQNRLLRWALVSVLIGLGAFLRVAYVETTELVQPVRADALEYVNYAYNLAVRGTFSRDVQSPTPPPDSFRSPGYPLFLATVSWIGGGAPSYRTIALTQAILSSFLVLLTYLLGSSLLPTWGALASALLVALSPHLITSVDYLLTETLFAFCLLASILLFSFAVRRKKSGFWLASGVGFGVSYLVNQTALLLPAALVILVCLPELWRSRRRAPDEARAQFPRVAIAVFLATFILFPLGWGARNKLHVPSEGASGARRALLTLRDGSYPGFVYKDERYRYRPYQEDPQARELASSFSSFGRILWSRIAERPLRYASWYIAEKPYYLWSWSILQGQGDVYIYPVRTSLYSQYSLAELTRLSMRYAHPIVVTLALTGLLLAILRRTVAPSQATADHEILYAALMYFTILYGVVFAPWPRYAIPLRPELYLVAVWTLVQVVERMRGREGQTPLPGTSGGSAGIRHLP